MSGDQCSGTEGTIFHKTCTPLTDWFWAIYRMSHDKQRIAAVQLTKEIGVSQTTTLLMQHKIRKAMKIAISVKLHKSSRWMKACGRREVRVRPPGTRRRDQMRRVAVEHADIT